MRLTSKTVTVLNTSNGNIIIKEGNAGVYRQIAIVESGKKFVLNLDSNATYRDYVLITLPDNEELPPFSSDNLHDWRVIVVKETVDSSGRPQFYWEYDPVEPTLPTPTGAPPKPGMWQSIKRFFR